MPIPLEKLVTDEEMNVLTEIFSLQQDCNSVIITLDDTAYIIASRLHRKKVIFITKHPLVIFNRWANKIQAESSFQIILNEEYPGMQELKIMYLLQK